MKKLNKKYKIILISIFILLIIFISIFFISKNSYSFLSKNKVISKLSENKFLVDSNQIQKIDNNPDFIYKVTLSNKTDLNNIYPYLFDDKLKDYNFSKTQINDYIVDYNDYVVVYDYENNKVKSAFSYNS